MAAFKDWASNYISSKNIGEFDEDRLILTIDPNLLGKQTSVRMRLNARVQKWCEKHDVVCKPTQNSRRMPIEDVSTTDVAVVDWEFETIDQAVLFKLKWLNN